MRPGCTAIAASCACKHEADHEGPHECVETQVCNGAWEDRRGSFEIVRIPGIEIERVSGVICKACIDGKHRECDELRFGSPCACIICAEPKRRIARA